MLKFHGKRPFRALTYRYWKIRLLHFVCMNILFVNILTVPCQWKKTIFHTEWGFPSKTHEHDMTVITKLNILNILPENVAYTDQQKNRV